MNTMKKIGFVGLGLIGGSIAKAIRQYYPSYEIIAFDKNKETLALATQESVVDVACTTIDDNFANCNYIFLCAPVSCNTAYLKQLTNYLHDDCILTDVGSVKTSIHKEVISLEIEEYFIGGHPMAGSEKSGFINSKAMLIENAYIDHNKCVGCGRCIGVCPVDAVNPANDEANDILNKKIAEYSKFVESLKALPVVLSYEEHDYITGVISHLPHIIASTLVNFVKESDSKDELMKHLAAGGFKDITRIASSSPTMWQHVCLKNSENIVNILDKYIEMLEDAKNRVKEGREQGIYDLFETSKNYRNSIPGGSSGPIKRAFAIYCDIIDEAGGIAAIATILAANNINLKNIGIVHNREFEEGVLRIEFYDEGSSKKAAEVLQKYRYIVYER